MLLNLAAICILCPSINAQADPIPKYRNFPIVFTIQFHSMNLPFRNLKSNFSNFGFGLGTEFSYNGRQNLTQQFTALWYRNKAAGNGLMFYTQAAWRPEITGDFFTEIKAGAGYLYSFRPVESFKQVEGQWESAGHRGKGMLALPVGISAGYNNFSFKTSYSPFISYQFYLASGYNTSIPIVPGSLIQVGTRVRR